MSDFSTLMGIGGRDAQTNMGCNVTTAAGTIRGVLTPAPVTFISQASGEQIEIDQAVDVFTSDLAAIGLALVTTAGLVQIDLAAAQRFAITADGKNCRLISYQNDGADPQITLYLKIAR